MRGVLCPPGCVKSPPRLSRQKQLSSAQKKKKHQQDRAAMRQYLAKTRHYEVYTATSEDDPVVLENPKAAQMLAAMDRAPGFVAEAVANMRRQELRTAITDVHARYRAAVRPLLDVKNDMLKRSMSVKRAVFHILSL